MAKFVQFGGRHVNLDRVEVIAVDLSTEAVDVERGKYFIVLRMPGYTCFEHFETEDEAETRAHELVFRAI